MGVSLKLTMPDLSTLVGGLPDAADMVLEGWAKDASTLKDILVARVTQRTLDRAFDTGALASSVTGQAYPNSKNGTIVAVWFNAAQQIAEWGRYYAPYQEGPPLGLSTYTNPPRHMLFDSQTEDAEQIRQWAIQAGTQTVEKEIASGRLDP